MPGELQEPQWSNETFWGEKTSVFIRYHQCNLHFVFSQIYTTKLFSHFGFFPRPPTSMKLLKLTAALFFNQMSSYIIVGSGEDCCLHEVTKIHEGSDKQQDGPVGEVTRPRKSWKMLINATAEITSMLTLLVPCFNHITLPKICSSHS